MITLGRLLAGLQKFGFQLDTFLGRLHLVGLRAHIFYSFSSYNTLVPPLA